MGRCQVCHKLKKWNSRPYSFRAHERLTRSSQEAAGDCSAVTASSAETPVNQTAAFWRVLTVHCTAIHSTGTYKQRASPVALLQCFSQAWLWHKSLRKNLGSFSIQKVSNQYKFKIGILRRQGLRTPNEGINQRYMKNWADVQTKYAFCSQEFVYNTQQCFAFTPQTNFPAHNLNFHSRWGGWNRIWAIFSNLFYFINKKYVPYISNAGP